MLSKRIDVDENRFIEVHDNVFDASDLFKFYDFAQSTSYKLERNSTAIVEDKGLATLRHLLPLREILQLGFHTAPKFRETLKRLDAANVRLNRAYINLCSVEDLFPYHVDSHDKEGLTILYYMNTRWEPIWEGETHFSNDNMTDLIASSSFIPGRFALFSPMIPHKSSQPSTAAQQFRFTYANKFVSKNEPVWGSSFKTSDLIIPLDSEISISPREAEAIEKLRPLACEVPHSGVDGFTHLYQTFKNLKWNGLDVDTCLAGLFHCVYGTGSFNTLEELKIPRESIREIIGSSAEQLVFDYKTHFPRTNLFNPDYPINPSIRRRLLWISYANSIEQAYRQDSFERGVLEHRRALDFFGG